MTILNVVASDLGFTEGPVVARDGSICVTSIDRGIVYRIRDGIATEIAVTGGGPNGMVEGKAGLLVAQNGGSWPAVNRVKADPGVQAIGPGGMVRTLTGGMRSPNDLAFGPDGYLYVTDPTRKPERDDGRIWRCDPASGESELILTCDWYPNGIGFSTEDDCFYVADTRGGRIVRFPLVGARADKTETVIQMDHNHPDGFAWDGAGNLVIAAPGKDGPPGDVQVWSREGKLLHCIAPGRSRYYTNVAIGPDRRIYVTDSDGGAVLAGDWPTAGLALHPFRTAAT